MPLFIVNAAITHSHVGGHFPRLGAALMRLSRPQSTLATKKFCHNVTFLAHRTPLLPQSINASAIPHNWL